MSDRSAALRKLGAPRLASPATAQRGATIRSPGREAVSTTVCVEPTLVVASWGPLCFARALDRLAAQTVLNAPAKLALQPFGAARIMAEVARGEDGGASEALALSALETAQRWFEGETAPARDTACSQTLAEAFHALPRWVEKRVRNGAEREFRLATTGAGRITATPLGGETVRLSAGPVAVRPADQAAGRAIGRFALEANTRLRLVRISLATMPGLVISTWEVVLFADAHLGASIESAVEALVVARSETERALRALANAAVAQCYLSVCGEDEAFEESSYPPHPAPLPSGRGAGALRGSKVGGAGKESAV